MVASVRSKVTVTCCASPVRFVTFAIKSTVSPCRRKRGTLGCTISSFCVMSDFESEPLFMSLVCATPRILHSVRSSGTVNEHVTVPSSPVRSVGLKNASVLRLVRTVSSSVAAPPSSTVSSISISASSDGLIATASSTANTSLSRTAPVASARARPRAFILLLNAMRLWLNTPSRSVHVRRFTPPT